MHLIIITYYVLEIILLIFHFQISSHSVSIEIKKKYTSNNLGYLLSTAILKIVGIVFEKNKNHPNLQVNSYKGYVNLNKKSYHAVPVRFLD